MTPVVFLGLKLVRYLPFVALLFVALHAKAQEAAPGTPIEKVNAYRDGDVFATELQTKGAWNQGVDVDAHFTSDAVQIDLPGAVLTQGKQLIKVDDRNFKSVYATQNDSSVRTRFSLNAGLSGTSLQDQIRIRRQGGAIVIEVTGDAKPADKKAKNADVTRAIAVVDEEGNEAIATKLVAGQPAKAEGVVEATVASTDLATAAANVEKKPDVNKLPENQIPVLSNKTGKKEAVSNPIGRLLITVGVLAVLLGATVFGLKRYNASRNLGPRNANKIRVLTQHPLGPKKSLAIIQVAGESILVGITDHNISMLKTLSLIDDEVPAEVPNRFDAALDDFETEERDDFASRDLSRIRDVVSTRLKNMRNI